MRGTLLSVPDDDVHYLYTSGYVPEETTYQGSGVPSPIEIRPDEICETPSLEICKEILFSQNSTGIHRTTQFGCQQP